MSVDPVSPTLWLAGAGALLAGLVRGFSGFGAAMIMVPLLATLYGPQIAVPVLLLTDYVLTLPIAWRARRICSWREILPLTAGHVCALPFGLVVLLVADASLLTRIIGLFVLAVAVVMALGYRRSRPPKRSESLAIGASAGLLSGAIGIGGPPVVLFWLSGQDGAPRVRANIFVFFALTGLVSMTALAWVGLITPRVLELVLWLMPVYLAGLLIGGRVFHGVDDAVFRRAALCIVAAIGIMAMITG